MDAIAALHQRVSQARLQAPAPSVEQVETLIRAATRAADHGNLQPWRFLVIEGDGLVNLGRLFAKAATLKKPDISQAELDRFAGMPLRAPMIIVAIAQCRAHPKVPEVEQLLAAGAAAQNIINASFALGLGAIWRTGDMAYDELVKKGLGLVQDETLTEQIVGFIYLGTPATDSLPPRAIDIHKYFAAWVNE